jgi:hemerythrin
MPIIWNDQYSVDSGAIDEDHRLLFRLFNQVEAEATRDPVGLAAGLRRFCDACERHFRRKERLQHAVRYPHAEDYRQRHANMLVRLEDMVERAMPLNDRRAVAALLADVRVWLSDHIVKHDMTLKPFAEPLRRAGEALGRGDLKNV